MEVSQIIIKIKKKKTKEKKRAVSLFYAFL